MPSVPQSTSSWTDRDKTGIKILRLTRLRLAGFKSFAEPTDLPILAGMTAVVGPNGSGKSNIVEALRWIMGESSPRRLRGQRSQDLIFSGSSGAPGRNIAQVSLDVTNAGKGLPAPLDREKQLTITRRIERGGHSLWQINGTTMRGRDIQLLFADASSGARAGAIIGQGEVSRIITAAPEDRRFILEEAAGITGLWARRKEAGSKLRATQHNLDRINERLAAIDQQMETLKKQERQARRYRQLGEKIKRLERGLWIGRLRRAKSAFEQAKNARDTAAEKSAAAEKEAGIAAMRLRADREIHEHIREKRENIGAALREAKEKLAAIDQEKRLNEEQRQSAMRRVKELGADMEAHDLFIRNIHQNRQRLEHEKKDIDHDMAQSKSDDTNASRKRKTDITAAIAALEEKERDDEQRRVAAQWQHDALKRDRERRIKQAEQYASHIDRLNADIIRHDNARASIPPAPDAGDRENAPVDDPVAAEQRVRKAEQRCNENARQEQKIQAALPDMMAKKNRIERRIQDLQERIGDTRSIATKIRADAQYRRCLSAALADDLAAPLLAESDLDESDNAPPEDAPEDTPENAPSDGTRLENAPPEDTPENAPSDGGSIDRFWRDKKSPTDHQKPDFPDGVIPLSRYIQADHILRLRLDRIGVVDDPKIGRALQWDLKPGQRLVDRQGRMWRWDGFCRREKDDLLSAVAHLDEAKKNLATILDQEKNAHQKRDEIAQQSDIYRNELERARADARAISLRLSKKMEEETRHAQKRARHQWELEHLRKQCAEIQKNAVLNHQRLEKINEEEAAIPTPPPIDHKQREKRDALRTELLTIETTAAALAGRQERHRRRHGQITTELQSLEQQMKTQNQRRLDLETEMQKTKTLLSRLQCDPEHFDTAKKDAQKRCDEARQKWILCEKEEQAHKDRRAELERCERQCKTDFDHRREEYIRHQEKTASLDQKWHELNDEITRIFDCSPDRLEAMAAEDDDPSLMDNVEEKIASARRSQENIGAVNLQACEQIQQQESDHADLRHERDDLAKAKTSLEKAVTDLEKWSAKRLTKAFDILQREFSVIFKQFFPGGACRIALSEDQDDPLQFGLEVFITLPGKKQRRLSLLSGGEQALCGLALVLASFIANPSPILVLDEVDAPLDEANLDVFCTVLRNILARHLVPALVVTHNILTMSRADRLYGVTLAHGGASLLASVDLNAAQELQTAS